MDENATDEFSKDEIPKDEHPKDDNPKDPHAPFGGQSAAGGRVASTSGGIEHKPLG